MIKLFQPEFRFDSIYDIPPDFFEKRGIRLLILDIDNTLVKHGAPVSAEARTFLRGLEGRGILLSVLSNNSHERLEGFRSEFGYFLVAKAGKPKRKGYLSILRHFGCTPEEAAAIGDQLFTDIAGGNRAGVHTILVQPISAEEPWLIRLKRRLERLVDSH